MKKVNVYTSKPGQGKSVVMIIDAVKAASSGMRVAYIAGEMSDRFVIKRMNHITKYFNLKGKISKNNLVVFSIPFGQDKVAFDKIESIKKDFDVLFLDPFEAILSFEHSGQNPLFNQVRETFSKLVNALDSESSVLKNIYTTISCYNSAAYLDNNIFFRGSQNLIGEKRDKVVLKKYISRNSSGENNSIVACDFENKSIQEYRLTEIMK